MRRVFSFVICLVAAAASFAQSTPAGFDLSNYGVRIEPDKRVMVVLAAIEMARTKNAKGEDERVFNTPLSADGRAFGERLASDNASLPDDLRRKIVTFLTQYKKRHPGLSDTEALAPFISMAYSLSPVPELSDPAVTSDLPGSLLDVLDFAPLVREFYRRSTIAGNLDAYYKDYQQASDKELRGSAQEMVKELLDYLHTRPQLSFTERRKVETKKAGSKSTTLAKIELLQHDRHFVIVPDKLAPRSSINFLNVRDEYLVVVPADTDLSMSQARRAFLQFVIDPVVLNSAKELAPMRDWAKPVLDELRARDANITPDIYLTIAKSLVAAVDIRENQYSQERIATDMARQKLDTLKTDAEKRKVTDDLARFKSTLADEAALRLYEDYQKGAVFSFYFAEQLKGLEDSGFDIAASLREMIASFDGSKETQRITGSAEARKRAEAARLARRNSPEPVNTVAENPVTKRLLEIQKNIDSKDYSRASGDLKQLLVDNPSDPRIYYNLGRVAGLEAQALDGDARNQKLLEAKVAYSNVLRTSTASTPKALLSLTYVALARLYEYFDDNSYAIRLYEEAIKLDRVPGGGFDEAIAGKARLSKPQ